jgi:hypothetical protein
MIAKSRRQQAVATGVGTAAVPVAGVGTECHADSSADRFRGKVIAQPNAKTLAPWTRVHLAWWPQNSSDAQRLEALVRDLQQLRDDADRLAF